MVIMLCCLSPKNWAGQVEHLGQFSISRSLQSEAIFDQRQQYGISAYFNDADTVYVNLYIPSRLAVKAGGTDCGVLSNGPISR